MIVTWIDLDCCVISTEQMPENPREIANAGFGPDER